MAHSLICSLPGTQVVRYGDEIGMGDDLSLKERLAVRTPMQWSDAPNAGFSTAPAGKLIHSVIDDGPFGYRAVNVECQLHDPDSLLNRMQRLIRARRSCPEIGWGQAEVLATDQPAVFAHVCRWDGRAVLALHNLGGSECRVRPEHRDARRWRLVDLTGDQRYAAPDGGTVELGAYGYRWFRLTEAGDAGRGAPPG
jgi:maltose alpha-D-glucosyltransferase/alpha-amylase